MRSYRGNSFTVWSRSRTWFWLVLDQQGSGGAIGTAASEAQAIGDARSSIEEMTDGFPPIRSSPDHIDRNVTMPASEREDPDRAAIDWMSWRWVRAIG